MPETRECIRQHRKRLDSVLGNVWTKFGFLGLEVAAAQACLNRFVFGWKRRPLMPDG